MHMAMGVWPGLLAADGDSQPTLSRPLTADYARSPECKRELLVLFSFIAEPTHSQVPVRQKSVRLVGSQP